MIPSEPASQHAGMPPSLPPCLLGFQGFYIRLTMLQTRRNIIRITRRTASRQQRRFDNTKASSGPAASSSGATHHSPHPEPVNESLGVSANRFRRIIDTWLTSLPDYSGVFTSPSSPFPSPSPSTNSPFLPTTAPPTLSNPLSHD